ncbi:CHAT domain-containing protein, partial [Kocuria arenosa]|uniref:CHAT domain-containing protein n=1 Tax=Kocuria arenosa TaxID=3071446 RepID=UPI0034D57E95
DLIAAHLPAAELAFLSACTTARTGVALPDEPIHLAAACQLAGYRHVIASLWPINDAETAWLTKYFYKAYTTTSDTAHTPEAPEAPATALHHTTRALRSHYPDHPSHWAPYTHTGP